MFKLKEFVCVEKINWSLLSKNPNAIDILEKNIYKIDWDML